jgi:hypothetical protein
MSASLSVPEVQQKPLVPRHALPAIGLAAVCAGAAFTEVSAEEGQILCPYRLVTGGWCPGCGCTRALRHLMHGDVRTSLALNPWMILVLAQMVVMSGFFLVMPDKAKAWWRTNDFKVLKINMAVAAVIWIARLWDGTIPLPFTG